MKYTNTVIQNVRTDILSSFVKTVIYKIEQISKPNVFIILRLNKKLSTKIAYRWSSKYVSDIYALFS